MPHLPRFRRQALALAALWPAFAGAQDTLGLKLTPQQALAYEPLVAHVTIENRGPHPLTVGAEPPAAALRFFIERDDGTLMSPRNTQPLADGLTIPPQETRTVACNLAQAYDLSAAGAYACHAVLKEARRTTASPILRFEIRRGFELQTLHTGRPEAADARLYVLSYLQRENGEDLYLRIENEAHRIIYGVFHLGRVVRFRPPSLLTDEAGNIHVLFQTIGMAFVHAAFTPFGIQIVADQHPGLRGHWRLTRLPNGQVRVVQEQNAEDASVSGRPDPRAPSAAGAASSTPP